MRRDVIQCPKVPVPVMGSLAVRAGDFIFVGGQFPTDYKTGLAPEVKKKSRGITNPAVLAKIQSDYILRNTQAVLKAAGSSLDYGVRIDQLVTRPEAASPYLDTRKNHVSPSLRPLARMWPSRIFWCLARWSVWSASPLRRRARRSKGSSTWEASRSRRADPSSEGRKG